MEFPCSMPMYVTETASVRSFNTCAASTSVRRFHSAPPNESGKTPATMTSCRTFLASSADPYNGDALSGVEFQSDSRFRSWPLNMIVTERSGREARIERYKLTELV